MLFSAHGLMLKPGVSVDFCHWTLCGPTHVLQHSINVPYHLFLKIMKLFLWVNFSLWWPGRCQLSDRETLCVWLVNCAHQTVCLQNQCPVPLLDSLHRAKGIGVSLSFSTWWWSLSISTWPGQCQGLGYQPGAKGNLDVITENKLQLSWRQLCGNAPKTPFSFFAHVLC